MSDSTTTTDTQPMEPHHLDRVRHAIGRSALLDPWEDAPDLLADRDHWQAEAARLAQDLDAMTLSAEMACQGGPDDCGCQLAAFVHGRES